MGLFGTLFTITGCDLGVRKDATWGSLRRYSPLQHAISGGGKDAECGSSGRYSPLQDAMWGSEMTPSGFTLTGSERTPKVALRDATHHYKTRLWGSEMTPDGVMSRWLGWAGWVNIFEYKGPRTRVASARLVPSRTRPRGGSRQGTLPPPIGTLITMSGCDDWPARVSGMTPNGALWDAIHN